MDGRHDRPGGAEHRRGDGAGLRCELASQPDAAGVADHGEPLPDAIGIGDGVLRERRERRREDLVDLGVRQVRQDDQARGRDVGRDLGAGPVADLDLVRRGGLGQVAHHRAFADAQPGRLTGEQRQLGQEGLGQLGQGPRRSRRRTDLLGQPAQPVGAAVAGLLDGLQAFERRQQPGHRALRQVGAGRQLGHAGRAGREGAQDGDRPLDRLDAAHAVPARRVSSVEVRSRQSSLPSGSVTTARR